MIVLVCRTKIVFFRVYLIRALTYGVLDHNTLRLWLASSISYAVAKRSISALVKPHPLSAPILFLMLTRGIFMRYIIKNFLKLASCSKAFFRRCSGVNPSLISSSSPASASFYSSGAAAARPGKDIPAGGGPLEIGNVLTLGISVGFGIFGLSAGGGGMKDFFSANFSALSFLARGYS